MRYQRSNGCFSLISVSVVLQTFLTLRYEIEFTSIRNVKQGSAIDVRFNRVTSRSSSRES